MSNTEQGTPWTNKNMGPQPKDPFWQSFSPIARTAAVVVPTGLTQTYGLKKKSKKQQTTKHKETKVSTERKINNNKQKQQTRKHTQTNHKTQTNIAYVHVDNGMQMTKKVITNNAKPPHNTHKTT